MVLDGAAGRDVAPAAARNDLVDPAGVIACVAPRHLPPRLGRPVPDPPERLAAVGLGDAALLEDVRQLAAYETTPAFLEKVLDPSLVRRASIDCLFCLLTGLNGPVNKKPADLFWTLLFRRSAQIS